MRIRQTRPVRIAKGIAVFLLGLSAGYLILANAFLQLGGMRLLTRGTNSIQVRFARAWTVWPTIVHARDLEVTIQDHNIQSSMEFRDVVLSVRMFELPRRIFHATRVRGSGFVFRFRHRVMPESANLPAVRALPSINGYEDPPVFEALAPEAPLSDDKYELWTVELDDVDVGAEEVWIEQFRYLGRARAAGAFKLKPQRSLWVGPASLALEPGRIVAGGQEAFSAFGGRVDAVVPAFDVRGPSGLEVFRFISASIHLRGTAASGAALELFLPEGARVEPVGAAFAADADLEHGVLSQSSKVAVAGSSLGLRIGKTSAELTENWAIVGSGDEERGGAVTASANAGSIRSGCVTLTTAQTSLSAVSTSRDAAAPWKLARLDASVREASASAQWGDFHASGRFGLDASASRKDGNARPAAESGLEISVTARAHDVRVKSGGGSPPSEMKFDVGAELRSSSVDLERRRAEVTGDVEVRNASLWNSSRRVDDWSASVRVERMRLSAHRTIDMEGRVVARFKDAVPGLLALSETRRIPDWIPTVLPFNGLSGTVNVHRRCRTMDIDLPRLKGGSLVGSGRIHAVPGKTSGAILLRYSGARVLSAGIAIGEDAGVSPLASDDWLSERIERMDVESSQRASEPCQIPRMHSCER